MGRLATLKISMSATILLVASIFSLFLIAFTILFNIPLYYVILGSTLFIIFQYALGPVIIRHSTGLCYLQPDENPWLESTVKNLASKGGVETPKLAVVPDSTPNAFVFGRTAGTATLAVHEGLLKQLNKTEVQGVIAHELGHIKHKDYLVMTTLSSLPIFAYLIARIAFETVRLGGKSSREKDKGGAVWAAVFVAAVLSYAVYFVSLLCVKYLSRLREHYADAYSAYLTGSPRQLESALTKITYGLSLSPKPPHGARTLYISDPALARKEFQRLLRRKKEYDLDKDGVLDERELELAMEKEAKSTWNTINTWFATHPPTFKRIMLLREIRKEMETGLYTGKRIYSHI